VVVAVAVLVAQVMVQMVLVALEALAELLLVGFQKHQHMLLAQVVLVVQAITQQVAQVAQQHFLGLVQAVAEAAGLLAPMTQEVEFFQEAQAAGLVAIPVVHVLVVLVLFHIMVHQVAQAVQHRHLM
jgi:hypothetical protein